jgi:hypothetical protein
LDGVHDVVLEIAGTRQMKGDMGVQIEQPGCDPLPVRGDPRRVGRHVRRIAHRADAIVVDQDAAVRPRWGAGSFDQRSAMDQNCGVSRAGPPHADRQQQQERESERRAAGDCPDPGATAHRGSSSP